VIRDARFVVFSDDWGRHPSSCQHLFRRIALHNRVLWVHTIGTRMPTLSRADLARAAGKLREWSAGPPAAGEDDTPVEILSPLMTPFDRWRPFRRLNARLLRNAVSRALALRGDEPPILVTTIPNAAGLVGELGEAASVYYCVDEYSEWPGADREAMLEMELELLARVDLVVAASDTLFEEKSASHPRVRLLRHGVDWERFERGAGTRPPALDAMPRPRIGFTGLVDARVDAELVARLAAARPDASFVFVGPRQLGKGPLDGLANVRFLPPVAYDDVPAVLAAFDVAMLPYVENRLTEKINPLKLREFLASGVPVVATPLPEVRRYRELVGTARDVDEWLGALDHAIREGRSRAGERSASVRAEGWDVRAEEFSRLCEEARAGARAAR
jgi:glycosyltransferase involved in cell wall biosynthesis